MIVPGHQPGDLRRCGGGQGDGLLAGDAEHLIVSF
jgi:hypothetical protein